MYICIHYIYMLRKILCVPGWATGSLRKGFVGFVILSDMF